MTGIRPNLAGTNWAGDVWVFSTSRMDDPFRDLPCAALSGSVMP